MPCVWAKHGGYMKAVTRTTTITTLILENHEAKWLMNIMQNPLHGQSPDNEPEEDKVNRQALWETLFRDLGGK